MRASLLRISALTSLLGLSSAQSTWAQSQPFDVDVSTESLLSSANQPLTNIVGTNTPSNTALLPAISVTEQFSTSIPTELSTVVSGGQTSLVFITGTNSASASASASETGSAASSRSAAASNSASASRSASASASQSGTGAPQQSTAAAAPTGVSGQQKMLGMAGALAGAAGVLFV